MNKPKFQPKPKPEPNLDYNSRALRPNANSPRKPAQTPQNNKKGPNKNNSTSNSTSLFGGKTKGQKCSSNQECFSTNCVFKGQQSGQGSKPKPVPKPKPAKNYGSRSLSKNPSKSKNGTKPAAPKPVYGTCQNEIEQDPVPKSNKSFFYKQLQTNN